MARTSLFVVCIILLTFTLTGAGRAAPQTGPCAPGASYDSACDVDHDGDVDIVDIQLAAGHWNRSGSWMSDNDHDHLGQTWIGSSSPDSLKLSGSYGDPNYAPLVLSNTASSGLRITSTGSHGVRVDSAGNAGVYVNAASNDGYAVFSAGDDGVSVSSAGDDGVIVSLAGSPSASTASSLKNGFEVAGAQGYGLYVGRADSNGVNVASAGNDGVVVASAGDDGVFVDSAGSPSTSTASSQKNGFEVAGAQGHGFYVGRADFNGVRVNSAGGDGLYVLSVDHDGLYVGSAAHHGVDVAGTDWAGVFNGFIFVSAACIGCLQANFAINVGDQALEPGDVVSIQAIIASDFDTGSALWQVMQAQPGMTMVGVVTGRAEVDVQEAHRPNETGKRLVPRPGAAQPGQYVTIVYSGPAQVKAAPGEAGIAAGMRVTAAADGTVRPLQTRTVEGMVVTEGAPVLGLALEAAAGGLVWVLVNPQ